MRLFHGTDPASAAALESGAALDPEQARVRHTDGELGFYLASDASDAEFFAVRHGYGRVITYEISPVALEALLEEGARFGPVPIGLASPYFSGSELYVPTKLFHLFNELLGKGEIHVHSELGT